MRYCLASRVWLRHHEAATLEIQNIQQREDHWAVVDLRGKGGLTRTVPVPDWVKDLVDHWTQAASIDTGRVFRRVTKAGAVWDAGITEKVVWHVVREYAVAAGIATLAPHDLRRYAALGTMPHVLESGRSAACAQQTDSA